MYDPARCWECEYSSHDNGTSVCMYLLIEGHRRGCYDGKECAKWTPRTGKHQKQIAYGEGFVFYEE